MGGDELKTAAPAGDREGAEPAVAGSEAWLRAVLDASPVPIALNDAHGNITYLTPSFTRTFGYQLADIPTLREWWPLAYPDPAYREWVATEWRRRMEQVRRDGTPFDPHEVIIRCKDGSLRTVIAGAALLVGAYEGTDMVTLQDITERKAAEEALRAANLRLADADRRKDEFLAVLSHELRNPLTPIRSSLEVLEHPQASDEQRRRAFAVIGRQVTHLARLVDDLLDVSRITQSKIRLQRARLDLVDAVARTLEDHRAALELREVVATLPDGPVWIEADATRLAQIVGNVISNAAKFTPPGGRVTVSLTRDGRDALLEVADTGVGVDAETLARIFEPFAQADRSLDRSRGGLGLGLALVKGMVELHGGRVAAHSDGPGHGARFTVRLPLDEKEEPSAGAARSAAARPAGRRVLLIEDNPDVADSLRDTLLLAGHDVSVAYDGETGLARARELQPDVVVCDIGLPDDLDGYAVARRLRLEPWGPHLFLVALTGYAQADDRQKALAAGFDVHVAKPPDMGVLMQLVAEGRRVAS